jgi:hypothetical protein
MTSIVGVWPRISLAFKSFFTILFAGRLPAALQDAGDQGKSPASSPAVEPGPYAKDASVDRAVQVLALLQREGRLVDFVRENLDGYSDAQIGAAARDVHAGCRRVLERYVTLEVILAGREGEPVTVGREQPIDPASFHIVGNVAGEPPFRGTLRHPGWRAVRLDLPPLAAAGRTIVAPAEIEVA